MLWKCSGNIAATLYIATQQHNFHQLLHTLCQTIEMYFFWRQTFTFPSTLQKGILFVSFPLNKTKNDWSFRTGEPATEEPPDQEDQLPRPRHRRRPHGPGGPVRLRQLPLRHRPHWPQREGRLSGRAGQDDRSHRSEGVAESLWGTIVQMILFYFMLQKAAKIFWGSYEIQFKPQSKKLTRGPPELVQHFRL